MLASLPEAQVAKFLEELSLNAAGALPWLFEFWGLPGHQLAPEGDWDTWLILGGRGAGKTRAGAEWVRAQVEGETPLAPGRRRSVALVAETLEQAQEVMVYGISGLLACAPPDRRPTYNASRRRLEWPNGAEARLYSAADPERLRGPQFDCAWVDELAKWKNGREAWNMLQFALRLGDHPQKVVTTTPQRKKLLSDIMELPGTVTVRAPTRDNAINLTENFLSNMEAQYGGSSLGRQELEGEFLTEEPGALWKRATIDAARGEAPELARVVVAVDPPVTSKAGSDECGIVVAGVTGGDVRSRKAYVLADLSIAGAEPTEWARRAVEAYHGFQADRIVAEVNQGGDLVRDIIAQIDGNAAFKPVTATRGKAARAEPVAALYEQGRVRHAEMFPELEDQMCGFTGDRRGGSPDRVDALVWAVTELMLTGQAEPRVRRL